jgi:hypothetical protein
MKDIATHIGLAKVHEVVSELATAWHARAQHIGRSLVLMHEFRAAREARPAMEHVCR